jgi:hypothetical protein
MNVFLVKINTEDGEVYDYVFCQKPSETKIKSIFYRDNAHTYKKKDWKDSISYEIKELTVVM